MRPTWGGASRLLGNPTEDATAEEYADEADAIALDDVREAQFMAPRPPPEPWEPAVSEAPTSVRDAWLRRPANGMIALVLAMGGIAGVVLVVMMTILAATEAVPWFPTATTYGWALSTPHLAVAIFCVLAATQYGVGTLLLAFICTCLALLVYIITLAWVLVGLGLNVSAATGQSIGPVFGAAMVVILTGFVAAAFWPLLMLVRLFPYGLWRDEPALLARFARLQRVSDPFYAGTGGWNLSMVYGLGGVASSLFFYILYILAIVAGTPWLPPTGLTYGLLWSVLHFFSWALCEAAATQFSRALLWLTLVVEAVQMGMDFIAVLLLILGIVLNPTAAFLQDPSTLFAALIVLMLCVFSVMTFIALVALVRPPPPKSKTR